MPQKLVTKIIKELATLINARFTDFKGLYLYGSHVKGFVHKDSDIDVVALFDEVDSDKKYELAGIICELMYKYDVYIDLHSYTPQKLAKNPIYYEEVVNKGLFYAKAA